MREKGKDSTLDGRGDRAANAAVVGFMAFSCARPRRKPGLLCVTNRETYEAWPRLDGGVAWPARVQLGGPAGGQDRGCVAVVCRSSVNGRADLTGALCKAGGNQGVGDGCGMLA